MNVRNFIMARRCRLAASAAASGRGSPFHSLDEKRIHIDKIKRKMKNQQSKENLKGKKQTNLALSEEVRRQLDHLAVQQRTTKVAVVERLIQHAAKNGMPNEIKTDRQALPL